MRPQIAELLAARARAEAAESPEHQELVGLLIEWIEEESFKGHVYAKYPGYEQCDETEKGHIPDVEGYDESRQLWAFGEAKTEDDIDNEYSRDQFNNFSRLQMKDSGVSVPFYIAIPKGSENTLTGVLKELGLEAKLHVHWSAF